METEQQIIKKKSRKMLYVDFNRLQDDEVIRTIKQIREKLIAVFRYHIGKENSITPAELFLEVYGINPAMNDIFKREYFWNVIKAVIRQLRKEEDCFIINNIHNLFVLQSREELKNYEKRINQHIENLENDKIRAREWINKGKWRDL
jgi:hypothetical protein